MDEQDRDKTELFNSWNLKQQELDSKKRKLLFKEGEIWWCSIGMNVGQEVYGKGKNFSRPVIILKKLSHNFCIILPITTKGSRGMGLHALYTNKKERWIMMNQMRSISANRLYARESEMTEEDFIVLKKSVAQLLGLL